jgi:hypothetical protein
VAESLGDPTGAVPVPVGMVRYFDPVSVSW